MKTLGTCSLCGGNVVVPVIWFGISPPTPSCERCGGRASGGPVIPMRRDTTRTATTITTPREEKKS